ncbi:type IV secretion system protein VirB10, partial [Sphingomonas sp. SFZ2018-12]|nr:type IV secretion system protein VirB10 [Sphingomonas sp. SFZ2018-12]
MTEIDRTAAVDRPNRIPSLNTVQWDNKKMIVGAGLAGAVVFGVLSLVTGVGGNNQVQQAQKKAPPPAAEAPYDPNSVIAPTLATAPRDPNAPVQLTGEQVPAIGPDGQPITPYASNTGQQGQLSARQAEAQRRA